VRGGVSECREELSEKFLAWLNRNRERIGEKWYKKLLKNFRKAKMDNEAQVLAVALWMFNMVCNLGVVGAIGVSFGYKIEKIYYLDRETTEDLLKTILRCLREMQLLAACKYFVS
jgi:hypothetical protein